MDRAGRAQPGRPDYRAGRPDDVPDIIDLIVRENHRRVDPDQVRRRIARHPSAVAHEGGELVAFIYSRRFAPDMIELSNMVVAARLLRRGIGSRLVAIMEEELVRHGYVAAIFSNSWLHPGNSPAKSEVARAFWRRMGYREIFGTGGPTVVFAKRLA